MGSSRKSVNGRNAFLSFASALRAASGAEDVSAVEVDGPSVSGGDDGEDGAGFNEKDKKHDNNADWRKSGRWGFGLAQS